ncbi:MAG: LCCL domain-containing protein [Pseudomonadota bacterium]
MIFNFPTRLTLMIALFAISLISGIATPQAAADGRSVNLTTYCDAANRTGFGKELAPRWTARYNTGKTYWECVEAKVMGFNTVTGGRVRPFDPSQACQWAYGSPTVHSHYGADFTKPSSVHCGISNGMRAAQGQPGGGTCPPNATKVSSRLSCTCSASQTNAGTVWGTNVYTSDSSICKAAVHAGAISKSGGRINIAMASGRSSYSATTRYGVASVKWGSWDRSFVFE